MRVRLAALAFGAGFGFVLGWARLHEPDVILAMITFHEPDVFLLMGAAIATAFVGTRILRARGVRCWADGTPVTWKTLVPTRNHVIGSVLFGFGWGVANTCPGPIAVQIGRGQWAGAFTAVGLMLGIALRDFAATRAARPSSAASPAPAVETAMSAAT